MAEDVTAFVQRVGLQTALEILGEDVWKYIKFSFEEWADAYRRGVNADNQEAKAKILAKMAEAASVTEHWLSIWGKVPAENPLRALVVEKIKERLQLLTTFDQVQEWQPLGFRLDFQGECNELNAVWLQRLAQLAVGFEQWKTVFYAASEKDSYLAVKAMDKMVEQATNGRRWLSVYHEAPNGSEAMKKALGYFVGQAKTYQDWFDVWYRARDKDNDLGKSDLQKVLDSTKTFNEWFSILSNNKDDTVLREFCIGKLLELAESFREWLNIYTSSDGQIKANALYKLQTKAKTLDEWLDIWRWTPKGSGDNNGALERVRGFVKMV